MSFCKVREEKKLKFRYDLQESIFTMRIELLQKILALDCAFAIH